MQNQYSHEISQFLRSNYEKTISQSFESFFNSSFVDRASCSPFRIDLNINYENHENDEEILKILIKEPKEFKLLCEDYIFAKAQQITREIDNSISLKREQISCSIRLTNIPMLNENKFSFYCTHLNLGLTFMRCIISEIFPVERYM